MLVIDPSTELAAVNTIIYLIGESPVNSLTGTTNVDVINARTLLQQESRKLQDKGWTFNIDENGVLTPDAFSGQITWKPTWLRVISDGGTPYVNRGGKVYDRVTKSNTFSGSLSVTLIEEVPFDELPYCFQTLATVRAARRFNANSFGAPEIDAEAARLEGEALVACNEYELDYGDFNLFTGDAYIAGQLTRS